MIPIKCSIVFVAGLAASKRVASFRDAMLSK